MKSKCDKFFWLVWASINPMENEIKENKRRRYVVAHAIIAYYISNTPMKIFILKDWCLFIWVFSSFFFLYFFYISFALTWEWWAHSLKLKILIVKHFFFYIFFVHVSVFTDAHLIYWCALNAIQTWYFSSLLQCTNTHTYRT